MTWIKGSDIAAGDVLETGHPWVGGFTVTSVTEDPDSTEANPFLAVYGTTSETVGVVSFPYRPNEDVNVSARAGVAVEESDGEDESPSFSPLAELLAFRELVRGIVHARPDDSDADVLALLEKDHAHRAGDTGCIYCE